jgi:signal peptidase I
VSSGPSTERGVGSEPVAPPPVVAPGDGSPDGHAQGEPAPPAQPGDPSESAPPSESSPPNEPVAGGKRSGGLSFLQELPFLLVVAFVLALLIKTFLVQAFYIPSESMVPTLKVGDRVLVNKLTYRFHDPRRGDIIVFQDPHPTAQVQRNPVSGFFHWLGEGLGLSTSADKDFIKRVIGLPGDSVEVRIVNGRGVVYVNGKPLREPYLSPIAETRPYGPTPVPAGELFVMGDNRTNSNDSRYGLGMIPMDKVVGRGFVIIWPPSQIRWLSGIHYPGL